MIVESNDPDAKIESFTYDLDDNMVEKFKIKLEAIRLLSQLYVMVNRDGVSLWLHEPKFENAVLKIQKKAREVYSIYEENFQSFYVGNEEEKDNASHNGFFIKGKAKLVRRLCFYSVIITLNDSK